MKEKLRIGFFGDSFVAVKNANDNFKDTETFIQKLLNYFDYSLANLGVGASALDDIYLEQLRPFLENKKSEGDSKIPDICVFSYTSPERLYNKEFRNMASLKTRENRTLREKYVSHGLDIYYTYLYDDDSCRLKYRALLEFYDRNIFSSPIFNNKKIIHLWSFGLQFVRWDDPNRIIKYPYRFSTGVEIRPALMAPSLIEIKEFPDCNWLLSTGFDYRPNHIGSKKYNDMIFEWIKTAIENYDNKKFYDHSDLIGWESEDYNI